MRSRAVEQSSNKGIGQSSIPAVQQLKRPSRTTSYDMTNSLHKSPAIVPRLFLRRAFSISTLHISRPPSSVPTSYAPSSGERRTSFREAEKRMFTRWKKRRQHQEAEREVGELRNSSAEGQSSRRAHERKYSVSGKKVS